MECYYHPNASAVSQCEKCAKFLCRECIQQFDDQCINCVKKDYKSFLNKYQSEINKIKQELIKKRKPLSAASFPAFLKRLIFYVLFILVMTVAEPTALDKMLFALIYFELYFITYITEYIFIDKIIRSIKKYFDGDSQVSPHTKAIVKELKDIRKEIVAIRTGTDPFLGYVMVYGLLTIGAICLAMLICVVIGPFAYFILLKMRSKIDEELQRIENIVPPNFENYLRVKYTEN